MAKNRKPRIVPGAAIRSAKLLLSTGCRAMQTFLLRCHNLVRQLHPCCIVTDFPFERQAGLQHMHMRIGKQPLVPARCHYPSTGRAPEERPR